MKPTEHGVEFDVFRIQVKNNPDFIQSCRDLLNQSAIKIPAA